MFYSHCGWYEGPKMRRTSNKTTVKARELRRTMSLPENMLWQALHKRPAGFKFRRQHPLGPFIVDFYCPVRHLAVEVDGEAHGLGDNPGRDKRRDEFLRLKGFRVIRFAARDVMRSMNGVMQMILAEVSDEIPLPHASHGSPPQAALGEASSASRACPR